MFVAAVSRHTPLPRRPSPAHESTTTSPKQARNVPQFVSPIPGSPHGQNESYTASPKQASATAADIPSGSISLPSSFSATSSEASRSGTNDREELESFLDKMDKTEEAMRQEVSEIIEKCDQAHQESQESLNWSDTHEVGGEGDTAMGNERSHLKRKLGGRGADADQNKKEAFRPRNLFDVVRGFTGGN